MKAEVYAATKTQKGRTQNEDHFAIGRGVQPMVAVADGAGNAVRSAKRAIDMFIKLHAAAEIERPAELIKQDTWKNWIRLLDTALLGGAQSTFCAFTMGAYMANGQRVESATGVCAGDTRLYLLDSNGMLSHITSTAKKTRLGSGQAEPITFHVELRKGDLLIVATDGAYSPMSLDELRRITVSAKMKHLSEVPMAILERAGKYGGLADDATALVVRCV